MIEDIRNIELYTASQLSNEDYHLHPYISSSGLASIFGSCPAQWKFGDKKSTPALQFGIASHAAVLEPELFNREFVCDINKNDESVITSDAALKTWFKVRGVPIKSTASFSDMIYQMLQTGEYPTVLKLESMILESECKFAGKTIVGFDDYAKIMQMRSVLFSDNEIVNLLQGSVVESSVICEIKINGVWHGVKIKPDIITKNNEVPDYKTTADMNPEKFANDAHNKFYWLRQSFVGDVLEAVHGHKFRMGLLAQGKIKPFIHQMYWLTNEQLEVGRDQYQYALSQYKKSSDDNVWPAYFNGFVDLPTPAYLANRYEFEDNSMTIIEEE